MIVMTVFLSGYAIGAAVVAMMMAIGWTTFRWDQKRFVGKQRSSECMYFRQVRVANAAAIAERFASSAWGESDSGDFLTSKLIKIAGEIEPAYVVAAAIEYAVHDYTLSRNVEGFTGLRKDVIAEILGADAESVAAIKEVDLRSPDAPPSMLRHVGVFWHRLRG